MSVQKEVNYTATNTYHIQNRLTENTKNIWMVFHGMGYLSKYFINYFSDLNEAENFIIAPQAPSKYYQDKTFKHVGASWLTRENTQEEIQNVLRYIDAVYKAEVGEGSLGKQLIVLGFSQGVSIAARWVASRQISCDKMILHSGGIPNELQPADFEFLNKETSVIYLYGNNDQYVTEARETEERLRASQLFQNRLEVRVFEGKHEMNRNFLREIAQ
ncbi:esterase [Vitellibacter sp. q18]|jgi:predicted esterase|nr:esterase [Aequorivita lutea]